MVFWWDKPEKKIFLRKKEKEEENRNESFLGKPGKRKQFEVNSEFKVIKY